MTSGVGMGGTQLQVRWVIRTWEHILWPREGPGNDVQIKWVPPHLNVEGNDRADELARQGRKEHPINLFIQKASGGRVGRLQVVANGRQFEQDLDIRKRLVGGSEESTNSSGDLLGMWSYPSHTTTIHSATAHWTNGCSTPLSTLRLMLYWLVAHALRNFHRDRHQTRPHSHLASNPNCTSGTTAEP